jgi:hypothetical protein
VSLGFDLSVTRPRHRSAAPWWHAYGAPSGALPALVLDGDGSQLHGASLLNGWTLDLGGLDLDAGFTFHASGYLDYAAEPATFPRLVEIGTDGDAANRQSLMVQKSTGRVRVISRQADVVRFSADFASPTVASGTDFATTIRFAPHDFAAHLPGAITQTDLAGGLPTGLDRLYLRSAAGAAPVPGHVSRVVLWDLPLPDTDLEGYAP